MAIGVTLPSSSTILLSFLKMTLTIVTIPKERVCLLQVVHAVQINPKPLTTVRLKRQRTQVLRISRRPRSTQYSPTAISMASSIFSGIATGHESSFPNSTYLRKRYRKLQKCKVSRDTEFREASPGHSSDRPFDPSFDAIRALNGQPDIKPVPVVVPAVIKDATKSNGAGNLKLGFPSPDGEQSQRPTSDQHAPQSFSMRVDRLIQAVDWVDGGLHIRYASSGRDSGLRVPAGATDYSSTGSGSWITEESTVDHGNLGLMHGHLPRSPFPTASLSSGSFPHRDSSIQRIDAESTVRRIGSLLISEAQRQQLGDRIRDEIVRAADANQGDDLENTSRRNGLLISESQRQQLEGRIQGEIARSANEDRRDSLETVIHIKPVKKVDPRVVRVQGREGRKGYNISPIPLDYQRRRNLATPSVDSRETLSDVSSPLGHVLARQATRTQTSASMRSLQSSGVLAGPDKWFPGILPPDIKQQARKDKEVQIKQLETNSRVIRWLHHVKEAFGYRKVSPTKKSGKSISVFKDNSSDDAEKWTAMPIARPNNALSDLTNVRQPGYWTNNSFAQEKQQMRQKKTSLAPTVQSGMRPRPRASPARPPASAPQVKQFELNSRPAETRAMTRARTALRGYVVTDSSPLLTETRSRRSGSRPSTIKPVQAGEELHPNVAFALARLEGRVPPPPLSPIRRWRDGHEGYGAHVEVELRRPGNADFQVALLVRLDAPEPVTPFLYGAWRERFEAAVDAGFDCAMAAPLSPGVRRYLDGLGG
ncbi:MAG: hypothetical protein Q9207_004170 [Kuettlingeria erythrocarpa]